MAVEHIDTNAAPPIGDESGDSLQVNTWSIFIRRNNTSDDNMATMEKQIASCLAPTGKALPIARMQPKIVTATSAVRRLN